MVQQVQSVSPEQALYNDLIGLGVTPAGAAGVLGNAQVESGFNPNAYNPAENAHGFFQWEGGRWTALQQYAQAHGLNPTSAQAEIGYLNTELTGPYHSVLTYLQHATDPAAAAAVFDVGPGGVNSGTGFENSSGSATQTRESFAQSIYGQITSGRPLTAGVDTGGSSSSATFTGAQSGILPFPFPGIGSNLPGGGWDPLNWPNIIVDKATGAVSSAAGGAAKGILDTVYAWFIGPIFTFLKNATLVIVGLVLIVLAIKMLADSDTAQSGDAGPPDDTGSSTQTHERAEDDAEDAAAAE